MTPPCSGLAAVLPEPFVVWTSTALGAVLSTTRLTSAVEVVVLPAGSVAIARRSMPPSGSAAMFSEHVVGLVVAAQTSVQLPDAVGACWSARWGGQRPRRSPWR